MRYVIFGAGAIGGLVGARLHQSGHEVVLITRGAHREAIARDGLTLVTPVERETFRIPVVGAPTELEFSAGDVVLLCVKTQDSGQALLDLRDAARTTELPIVCMQNGVANEPMALRLFSEVYGAVVMVPADHLSPGVVVGYGSQLTGMIDIGRYPDGSDEISRTIASDLAQSDFLSEAPERIMPYKYAKLINNLVNGIEAICGPGQGEGPNQALIERAREEGRSVLRAAGIDFDAGNVTDTASRWERIGFAQVEGRDRQGGSGWQSVVRGTGSIETDYLNGEIVLLGRQLGVPTPVNETIQSLARETVRAAHQPGWLTPEQVLMRADGRSSAHPL